MDKYEYFTGEDLEYKPEMLEINKFEYSQLFEALKYKVKSKTDQKDKTNKTCRNKNLIYNLHQSFPKFKNISNFKELSLNLMDKILQKLHTLLFLTEEK